jgi:hypothetical protein
MEMCDGWGSKDLEVGLEAAEWGDLNVYAQTMQLL